MNRILPLNQVYCVVKHCNNTGEKLELWSQEKCDTHFYGSSGPKRRKCRLCLGTPMFSLFPFPADWKSSQETRKTWLRLIFSREDVQIPEGGAVCSVHFDIEGNVPSALSEFQYPIFSIGRSPEAILAILKNSPRYFTPRSSGHENNHKNDSNNSQAGSLEQYGTSGEVGSDLAQFMDNGEYLESVERADTPPILSPERPDPRVSQRPDDNHSDIVEETEFIHPIKEEPELCDLTEENFLQSAAEEKKRKRRERYQREKHTKRRKKKDQVDPKKMIPNNCPKCGDHILKRLTFTSTGRRETRGKCRNNCPGEYPEQSKEPMEFSSDSEDDSIPTQEEKAVEELRTPTMPMGKIGQDAVCAVERCKNSGKSLVSFCNKPCQIHSNLPRAVCACPPPFHLFPFPQLSQEPDGQFTEVSENEDSSMQSVAEAWRDLAFGRIIEPDPHWVVCSKHFAGHLITHDFKLLAGSYPTLELGIPDQKFQKILQKYSLKKEPLKN